MLGHQSVVRPVVYCSVRRPPMADIAQMINFPVGIGTTGHLVGGALLACTLGPAAGVVVMAAILAIQQEATRLLHAPDTSTVPPQ